jgi:PAS domain S-box-containing protein
MREACTTVAEMLEVEYAKVLEVRGDEATLRQGVGRQAGAVGEATVPLEADSQAGYTLRSAEPVVVDDLRSEVRFAGPDLLVDHDVVSGISVLIGSVSQPWGVFGVHTTKRREFAEHDINFVQSIANVLGAAVEDAATKRRLRERERQFSTLIDNVPGVVYRCENEPGRAAGFVSDGARELSGYDPEAFERGELRWGEDLQIEADRRGVWEEIQDGVAEREPYHVTYRIETASGRRRWVTDHGQGIVDERGDLEALERVIFDVTEKRQLEDEFAWDVGGNNSYFGPFEMANS